MTAFAAGHRPCALCRREDFVRFSASWRDLHPGQVGADAMDEQLHAERVEPGTRAHRLHEALLEDLPDGAFVLWKGEPRLVLGTQLLAWSPRGYVARSRRPRRGEVALVTPPSLVHVIRAGWRGVVPPLHRSAL